MQFHRRNTADGFRVQRDTPKAAVRGTADAVVREATRIEGKQPMTVGCGIASDPEGVAALCTKHRLRWPRAFDGELLRAGVASSCCGRAAPIRALPLSRSCVLALP